MQLQSENLTDEVAMIGLLSGLLVVAFTREKQEDEYVQYQRLRCLQIAVLINYLVLVLGIALVYGLSFLMVLFWNMFTTLILFIVLFKIQLARIKHIESTSV